MSFSPCACYSGPKKWYFDKRSILSLKFNEKYFLNSYTDNVLITEREDRTGKYWPQAVAVQSKEARSVQMPPKAIFPSTVLTSRN